MSAGLVPGSKAASSGSATERAARTIKAGAEEYVEPPDPTIRGREDDDAPMAFAY